MVVILFGYGVFRRGFLSRVKSLIVKVIVIVLNLFSWLDCEMLRIFVLVVVL